VIEAKHKEHDRNECDYSDNREAGVQRELVNLLPVYFHANLSDMGIPAFPAYRSIRDEPFHIFPGVLGFKASCQEQLDRKLKEYNEQFPDIALTVKSRIDMFDGSLYAMVYYDPYIDPSGELVNDQAAHSG
jgi:hypothetical protein